MTNIRDRWNENKKTTRRDDTCKTLRSIRDPNEVLVYIYLQNLNPTHLRLDWFSTNWGFRKSIAEALCLEASSDFSRFVNKSIVGAAFPESNKQFFNQHHSQAISSYSCDSGNRTNTWWASQKDETKSNTKRDRSENRRKRKIYLWVVLSSQPHFQGLRLQNFASPLSTGLWDYRCGWNWTSQPPWRTSGHPPPFRKKSTFLSNSTIILNAKTEETRFLLMMIIIKITKSQWCLKSFGFIVEWNESTKK